MFWTPHRHGQREKISAEHLIIATGSSPAVLPIPGLQEALHSGAAVTSTGALKLKKIPERLVVVGGELWAWNLPLCSTP